MNAFQTHYCHSTLPFFSVEMKTRHDDLPYAHCNYQNMFQPRKKPYQKVADDDKKVFAARSILFTVFHHQKEEREKNARTETKRD